MGGLNRVVVNFVFELEVCLLGNSSEQSVCHRERYCRSSLSGGADCGRLVASTLRTLVKWTEGYGVKEGKLS